MTPSDVDVWDAAQFAKALTAPGRRQVIEHLVLHDPAALLRVRDALRARTLATRIDTSGT